MTYLIGILVTFFALIFVVRKFNKKYDFYKNNDPDKMTVVAVLAVISGFWFLTVPMGIIFIFFYFVAKASTKLLK